MNGFISVAGLDLINLLPSEITVTFYSIETKKLNKSDVSV